MSCLPAKAGTRHFCIPPTFLRHFSDIFLHFVIDSVRSVGTCGFPSRPRSGVSTYLWRSLILHFRSLALSLALTIRMRSRPATHGHDGYTVGSIISLVLLKPRRSMSAFWKALDDSFLMKSLYHSIYSSVTIQQSFQLTSSYHLIFIQIQPNLT